MTDIKRVLIKIKKNISHLEYRISQLSCSKKNVKFYYANKISEIRLKIKDLRAQLIFYQNKIPGDTIDLHGANRYFVDNYLDDIIYYKYQFSPNITVITGKGTKTLYNYVNRYLTDNEYNYIIIKNNFEIKL